MVGGIHYFPGLPINDELYLLGGVVYSHLSYSLLSWPVKQREGLRNQEGELVT